MARFATVSREGLNDLVADKDSPSTKKQTDVSFNVLLAYCDEKVVTFVPETISKSEVSWKFYFSLIIVPDKTFICKFTPSSRQLISDSAGASLNKSNICK